MKTILALADPRDSHFKSVQAKLSDHDVQVVNYTFNLFPERSCASFVLNDSEEDLSIIKLADGTCVDLNNVFSVWYYRPFSVQPNPNFDKAMQAFIKSESDGFIHALPYLTLNAFWVSRPQYVRAADFKTYNALVAKHIGFNVPSTYFGNDPEKAKEFVSNFPEVVIKTLASTRPSVPLTRMQKILLSSLHLLFPEREDTVKEFNPQSIDEMYENTVNAYTHKLKNDDLINYLPSIIHSPVILQPFYSKYKDIRVTVVGNQVFACAIDSIHPNIRNAVDIRDNNEDLIPHEAHDLPASISDKCVALLRALNLEYGTIDLILTHDGEYIYLEINPSGLWLWIERLSGLPIAQAMADLLMNGRT